MLAYGYKHKITQAHRYLHTRRITTYMELQFLGPDVILLIRSIKTIINSQNYVQSIFFF